MQLQFNVVINSSLYVAELITFMTFLRYLSGGACVNIKLPINVSFIDFSYSLTKKTSINVSEIRFLTVSVLSDHWAMSEMMKLIFDFFQTNNLRCTSGCVHSHVGKYSVDFVCFPIDSTLSFNIRIISMTIQ